MSKHLKETVFNEIEQRWAIDPRRGLIVPSHYNRFHQAEIATGPASEVISIFRKKVSKLGLGIFIRKEYREVTSELDIIYKKINPVQGVKLRVRSIIDSHSDEKKGQLTLKEKLPSLNGFKVYKEHDIPISYELAEQLIKKVSPDGGVIKDRYNVAGPDKRLWDIDIFFGDKFFIPELGIQLTLGEIEVDSTDAHIDFPEWAVYQMNGFTEFKKFGTAGLQETPWQDFYEDEKIRFRRILDRGFLDYKIRSESTI